MKKLKFKIICALGLLIVGSAFWWTEAHVAVVPVLRIGCYLDEYTASLYHAHTTGGFVNGGVHVMLVTPDENGHLVDVPSTPDPRFDPFRKNTRVQHNQVLMRLLHSGEVDGICITGASFLASCEKKAGLVAVTTLAQDVEHHSSHVLAFKKSIEVRRPQDLRGLTLWLSDGFSQQSAVGEFLEANGMVPQRDVKLIVGSDGPKFDVRADGGYFNLVRQRFVRDSDDFVIYRSLDWVDPHICCVVLAIKKDDAARFHDAIGRFLRAYEREVQREDARSSSTQDNFLPPHAPRPVALNVHALASLQALMMKHGFLHRRFDVNVFTVPFGETSMPEN